ncbi:MAG: sensor histidine kinase [Acidobacteriaceae bacterium]
MTAALQQQKPDRSIRQPLSAGTPEERRTAGSHLAHDARNWLTVLRVYCDLLRASGTVAGEGLRWMEELSNAVERGQGLVTSLLDCTMDSAPRSPSSPRAVAPPKPLDLGVAIQRRLPVFRQMAGSAIQVQAKTVAHPGATALKELEFERILLNLVRNAIEAMPDGGRLKIVLEHGNSSERPSLVLKVSDTGNGIAAEFLPRIFDSGFSNKLTLAGPPSGRGFGLAIVRELALGAGGSARVRSRTGHGTSFTVELPLLSPPSSAGPRMPASRQTKLAVVAEMPKPKPGRQGRHNNFAANRKGTRVPC